MKLLSMHCIVHIDTRPVARPTWKPQHFCLPHHVRPRRPPSSRSLLLPLLTSLPSLDASACSCRPGAGGLLPRQPAGDRELSPPPEPAPPQGALLQLRLRRMSASIEERGLMRGAKVALECTSASTCCWMWASFSLLLRMTCQVRGVCKDRREAAAAAREGGVRPVGVLRPCGRASGPPHPACQVATLVVTSPMPLWLQLTLEQDATQAFVQWVAQSGRRSTLCVPSYLTLAHSAAQLSSAHLSKAFVQGHILVAVEHARVGGSVGRGREGAVLHVAVCQLSSLLLQPGPLLCGSLVQALTD